MNVLSRILGRWFKVPSVVVSREKLKVPYAEITGEMAVGFFEQITMDLEQIVHRLEGKINI